MSPIELIEQGIVEQDWGKIEEAYTNLTGKSIKQPEKEDAPKKKRGRPRKTTPTIVDAPVEVSVEFDDDIADKIIEKIVDEPNDNDKEVEKAKLARNPREIPDFTVNHGSDRRVREDGGTICRTVPAVAVRANRFKDKGTLAVSDIEIDRKLTRNGQQKPVERREEATLEPTVEVGCDKCGDKFERPESEVKVRLEDGEDPISNVCLKCIRKVVRRD